jgi:hypothetical protein
MALLFAPAFSPTMDSPGPLTADYIDYDALWGSLGTGKGQGRRGRGTMISFSFWEKICEIFSPVIAEGSMEIVVYSVCSQQYR